MSNRPVKTSFSGVSFRVTPHPVAAALSRKFGKPVVSTSANISGGISAACYDDAQETFGQLVDMVLKNKEIVLGQPSTVVDCTSSTPEILRIGTISRESLLEVL